MLVVGTGTTRPIPNDSVKVAFAGWTADGAPFMDAEAVTFHLEQGIAGWREALLQMVVGEKRRLWVPASLGYQAGQAGQARQDGPAGALVFDLQLLAIIPGPSAPPDVAAAPADATRLQDGLASKVLAAGGGKVHPGINDLVTLTFASWSADGTPFLRGDAVHITVGSALPGWIEALSLMVAGEKRRAWIPPPLAYAGKPGAPTGTLVVDFELVEITPGPKAPPYVWAPPADAKVTKDGLASKVFVRGRGHAHPRMNDGVRVHFTAWDRDGRLRDASGETAVVRPVSKDFPGWAEGLKQRVAGETRIRWIPAALEPEAVTQTSPPSDLSFLVELVEILPAPKTPADVKGPPRSAVVEPNGVASKVLVKGSGSVHPRADSTIEIEYASWTSDGKFLSASSTLGNVATVGLGGDAPGWADALRRMVAGEKRRIWIPRRLALSDDEEAPAPKTGVVVDVELRRIDPDARL